MALSFLLIGLVTSLSVNTRVLGEESTPSPLQRQYTIAKSNFLAHPRDLAAATAFAHASADWADYITQKGQRARVAEEGIQAARQVIASASTNAAGHFYLALNIGELAQTKTLGALSLVKEMQGELIKALELDPSIEHGGPDRSLGMLYRDTPGRPFSIGNQSKAREHLEAALKIAPDYPDNLLSLMESYLKWDDRHALKALAARYEKVLPDAQKKYAGPEFEQAWRDWEVRWKTVREKAD